MMTNASILLNCILMISFILWSMAATNDLGLPFEFSSKRGSVIKAENILTESLSNNGLKTDKPQPIKEYNNIGDDKITQSSEPQSKKPIYYESSKKITNWPSSTSTLISTSSSNMNSPSISNNIDIMQEFNRFFQRVNNLRNTRIFI